MLILMQVIFMAIFPDEIPSFLTDRLVLRPLEEEYFPSLHGLWAATLGQPLADARARTIYMLLENLFFNRQGMCWVLLCKYSGEVIGTCELHNFRAEERRADVGCEIFPAKQRQGYMTEALLELIHYSFGELALYDLIANVEENNGASVALFKKIGFEREGSAMSADKRLLLRFMLSRKIS